MTLFPRFHLFEIEDQSWCPEFVVKFIQTYLTALWNFRIPAVRHTAAEAAANIILENLPDASLYTFVDPCAGAGGPIPAIEKALGTEYRHSVQFILADIKPRVEEWKAIKKEQKNISFIQDSVDAAELGKVTSGKECRIFNISFHHFNDASAKKVLHSAMQFTDAYIIFEFLQRDLTTFLFWCVTTISPLPFVHALLQGSLLQMCFMFVIWVALGIDGFVSMLRTRTHEEIKNLTRAAEGISEGWVFKHGRSRIFGPWYIHWHLAFRTLDRKANNGEEAMVSPLRA
ncbi:hypothetical protein C8Q69DRAFT_486489 [Paecilomyces variotii]|uniref:Methyltransferase domain-containing protein n=1 Tax=Byssochlamys spectabilis TaxID=264951 RepID=A0A443HUB6_BYSSP|nr:hypothetical protein C8Q69DRAFT_486489 [Paecilomyces variotii]KAJ9364839.1 hypothetical protein DTO280E4_1134 [Paecilomyces variotii]RWQ95409.1 hypothetical protein C8Q69DRAFT_486489 [Paecilomyces variotii]